MGFAFDPFARVTSPEKKQSPGPVSRFDRVQSAELSTLVALLRPSGTLNTLPEIDPILEAGFGTVTNVTLDTTIKAGGAGTTTQDDFTSVSGLAVGNMILMSRNSVLYVRHITAISTNTVTWAPALPSGMEDGEQVQGGITYKLSSALATGLTMAHYLDNFSRELLGVGALELAFDANEEPRATASGPASNHLTGSAQSQPAGFTTVGGNPPSGLVGDLYIGDTAYPFKSLQVAIANALRLRNQEYGVNVPTEIYRAGRREITLSLDVFAETEATLYDLAEAGTNAALMKQTGRTEGNIVALRAPSVEWKVPSTDDPDEEVSWGFERMALESADDANDELYLGLF